MGRYYYKKTQGNKLKKFVRLISILLIVIGILTLFYVLLPFISWQIYFSPVFASQNIVFSIPNANIIDLTKNSLDGTDYTRAENWFPKFSPSNRSALSGQAQADVPFYRIAIPSIKIGNAQVSTVDTDLKKHLVNYQGTGIPGKNGNAVIFGHSTLPQLFNAEDYKTIFSNAYKLKNGDSIFATVKGVTYTYKIFKIIVVDPSDTQALIQDYSNSYITLVTCTPPGTIWKRLVVKARLETI